MSKKVKTYKKKDLYIKIFVAVFFSIVFYFYLHNVTRDVYSGDIGDLATAAYTFGIPHPPGYPTLTLLGFLFSHLPLPLPIIARISLVSVLSAFLGCVIFFKFVMESIGGERINKVIIGVLSTSVLAFSYYYWLYAEVPEVFGLSNLFLIAIYYCAYKFYKTRQFTFLYLTAFIGGLCVTNQQAVLSAMPGVMVLVVPGLWRGIFYPQNSPQPSLIKRGRILAKLILVFLVGLSAYLYVFVSASTHPQINWMGEPTLRNFVRLVLRLEYPIGKDLVNNAFRIVMQKIYFSTLVSTFTWMICSVGVLGAVYMFKKDKQLFLALLTGFIFCGSLFLFVITPFIIDPDQLAFTERFYIQSFILFVFFVPFGFLAVQRLLIFILPRKIYGTLFLLPFFAIIVYFIVLNGQRTDLSSTRIGFNVAYDLVAHLPKRSILFLYGDTATFNTWYAHYVLGLRNDIALTGALGDRNDIQQEVVAQYRKENPHTMLNDDTIFGNMLPLIQKRRRIFSMYVIPVGTDQYVWVSKGLVYELTPLTDFPQPEAYKKEMESLTQNWHIVYRDRLALADQNIIAPMLSRLYSDAFVSIGNVFAETYKDNVNALVYYQKAKAVDASNAEPLVAMALIQSDRRETCNQAIKNVEAGLMLNSIKKAFYQSAFKIYKRCGVDGKKVEEVKKIYKELFKEKVDSLSF